MKQLTDVSDAFAATFGNRRGGYTRPQASNCPSEPGAMVYACPADGCDAVHYLFMGESPWVKCGCGARFNGNENDGALYLGDLDDTLTLIPRRR